jgi:prolyl oligopeptidase family protein
MRVYLTWTRGILCGERARCLISILITLYGLFGRAAASADIRQPLTIADAIETTRVMITKREVIALPDGSFVTSQPMKFVLESPDGKRFVVMLIKGDIKRNGVWAEFVSGRLDSSFNEISAQVVARFFTAAVGSTILSEDLTTLTISNPPTWIDDGHIAFFWEGSNHKSQVVTLDVDNGSYVYETEQDTAVTSFTFGPNASIIFGASTPQVPSAQSDLLRLHGYAVTSPDAISLAKGDADGKGLYSAYDYDRFLKTKRHPEPRKIAMDGGGVNRFQSPFFPAQFSADGLYAIVDGTPAQIPPSWTQYEERHFQQMLKDYATNPDDFYARQFVQLFVIDMEACLGRPLWDAPIDVTNPPRAFAWSADDEFLLVGPTYLPSGTLGSPGLTGKAMAVVDVKSGAFLTLPMTSDEAAHAVAGRWVSDNQIEISLIGGGKYRFQKLLDEWKRDTFSGSPNPVDSGPQRVRVEVRQSIDSPPALYAVDTVTKRVRLLMDFESSLRNKFRLGRQEIVHFRDGKGRTWPGRLYYPVHYRVGHRYPLVIQYRTPPPDGEYSIYGQGGDSGIGLGPGIGPYAAAILAGQDIATLELGAPDFWGEHGENDVHGVAVSKVVSGGFEAAIDFLAKGGLVDSSKVGLMGHSATGLVVEYAISHSDFPYAAAIASDNVDGSYFQNGLFAWQAGTGEAMNGAPAFGKGLQQWIENSPAFNVDHVKTPTLLITSDPSAGGLFAPLMHWEMFSRLRYLKKPVELYVVPDLLHSSHTLQNPAQLLAMQQRVVDWWCFWLKGKEDPEPAKASQYASWRGLRELQLRGSGTPYTSTREPEVDHQERP